MLCIHQLFETRRPGDGITSRAVDCTLVPATRHMNLHALNALKQLIKWLQKEASEVFFAVTKLFQNSDVNLRRMMYLCLKDICPDAAEVMIVTNSLMKDMNAPQELYRANAIRVLRTIIDPSLLQQIERYFKQCIVDKSPVCRC
jgi:coatomer subunit gamma